MITHRKQIRSIAFLLVVVYLFLSGFMMTGLAEHITLHGHSGHHDAQHTSLFCNWMCAASAFVHSADPNVEQVFTASYIVPAVYIERFFTNLTIFSWYIRPPPFHLF